MQVVKEIKEPNKVSPACPFGVYRYTATPQHRYTATPLHRNTVTPYNRKTTNFVIVNKSKENILNSVKHKLELVAPKARVILYGSRARGDDRPGSDWDILIILDKKKVEPGDFDIIAYPLYELGWQLDEHFSVKLYTEAEWQRRIFTPFYKNVEKDGIVI